ncbi:hypothetical protein Sa4125_21020 [Aureimonas sp. SA4125]|nr:hypothetical protein Sa4125_21020 [Aureimonas sp. SA4125]
MAEVRPIHRDRLRPYVQRADDLATGAAETEGQTTHAAEKFDRPHAAPVTRFWPTVVGGETVAGLTSTGPGPPPFTTGGAHLRRYLTGAVRPAYSAFGFGPVPGLENGDGPTRRAASSAHLARDGCAAAPRPRGI